MASATLEHLLHSLLRLRLVRLAIGPCGMHLDFAVDKPTAAGNHLSRVVVVQCSLRISREGTPVYESYPSESDADELRRLLLERRVNRVAVDPQDNSLQVLFDKDLLASAFPDPKGKKYAYWWSIHNLLTRPESGFVVYRKNISIIKAPSRKKL